LQASAHVQQQAYSHNGRAPKRPRTKKAACGALRSLIAFCLFIVYFIRNDVIVCYVLLIYFQSLFFNNVDFLSIFT